MIGSYREPIERAINYPKTPEITERAKALLERINAMEEAYQAKAIDKSEQADDMPALMPDTAISVSERDLFGYTDNAILPLTKDKAIELFNKDISSRNRRGQHKCSRLYAIGNHRVFRAVQFVDAFDTNHVGAGA